MSHSRLAIYDRSGLIDRDINERCIGVLRDVNRSEGPYYYNPDYLYWYPHLAPFPTPLIYLKQKKP